MVGTAVCGQVPSGTKNGEWYEVRCTKPLRGNRIRLETTQNTYLSIAGIEVWTASVTTTTTTTHVTEGSGYKSLVGEQPQGCYKDAGKRDLENDLRTDVPRKCFELAISAGYKYAGLQYGGQCWAGNEVGMYGKRPDGECQMPCRKDPKRKCGAGWRNSVYVMPITDGGDAKAREQHGLIFGKVH